MSPLSLSLTVLGEFCLVSLSRNFMNLLAPAGICLTLAVGLSRLAPSIKRPHEPGRRREQQWQNPHSVCFLSPPLFYFCWLQDAALSAPAQAVSSSARKNP